LRGGSNPPELRSAAPKIDAPASGFEAAAPLEERGFGELNSAVEDRIFCRDQEGCIAGPRECGVVIRNSGVGTRSLGVAIRSTAAWR
jgi:hypothetical protein